MALLVLSILAACSKDKPGEKKRTVIVNIESLTSIVVGENSTVWIGSNSGLLGYDGTNWKLFTPSGMSGTPLPVSDLAADATGIWMGTMSGAIYVEATFENIAASSVYSAAFTGSDTVTCISVDHQGRSWFATPRGISANDGGSWPTVTHFYGPTAFSSSPITSIGAVNDTCYAGTRGGGLIRYIIATDGVSGASALWPSNGCGLNDKEINCLFTDNANNLWIGMPSGAQKHIGSNPFITGTNWVLYTTDSGLVSNNVTAITQDQDGRMWFGTGNGTSMFDGSNWSSYTVADGMAGDSITDLATGANHDVWAVAGSTLSYFDGNSWSQVEVPQSFTVKE